MDTFVDSSWYFLRYCDPHNDQAPFDRGIVDFWMPVDQYIGGIDHATGHLLYSRFFVKVLNELGLVGFREPFARLFHQGWVRLGGSKMSKSRGNVTAPDQLAEMYGADAVRLFILFMGPADQDMEWSEEGVEGIARFLRRLWRLVNEIAAEVPRDGGGQLTLRLFDSTKPVIAAINGPAVGVGITMTLAMDVRLAAEGAKIGFVFTRRGIVPEACSSWFLPRAVGISRAVEWTATGRVFPAEEGLEAGLFRSLHPADQVLPAARELAREIADNTAPVSVALARRMIRRDSWLHIWRSGRRRR